MSEKKPSSIFSVAALNKMMAEKQAQMGGFKDPNQVGIVLAIDLKNVIEDTDQPRQVFDDEAMQALIDDVKIRGIQAPIAVRPSVEGIYKIIHGARRYRAALAAGLPKVPVIVQTDAEVFDDYSQVAENTKRAGLHPMDIARFIQKRKDLGEKNKYIAERLGESSNYILYHLALIEAPAKIRAAFDEGRIRGAESVWSLVKLQEKSPDAVEQLLDGDGEITRQMIRNAGSVKPVTTASAPLESSESLQQDSPKDDNTTLDDGVADLSPRVQASTEPKTRGPSLPPKDAGDTSSKPSAASRSSTTSPIGDDSDDGGDYPEGVSGKPIFIATWNNQEVVLVPDEIPSRIGLVWIQNTETEELFEVNAHELTLLRLDYERSE